MTGKTITAVIDRPLGSSHPKYPDMIYPVNYGYIKGITAPDGDDQDAYILGVDRPVDSFSGMVIAVIIRADDCEEKWVVVPQGVSLTCEEIETSVAFQEQYFRSQVLI